MITGYCVKCKEKGVELSAPEIHQTSKGGYMAKGKHEKCGTTVCAMMSKDNAEKAVEEVKRKILTKEEKEKKKQQDLVV